MPQNSEFTAEALLNTLLDRLEAPKVRVRDITVSVDYTRVGGPAEQDEFHRVLNDAEREGAVRLESGRLGRFTGELARVRLVDAPRLYAFLVRSPAKSVAEAADAYVGREAGEVLTDPFFETIKSEAAEAWATNRSFLGFTAADVDDFVVVIRLAHAIVHLNGRDIDHRTFSRRVVKNSKALERWEGRVTQLLRRHDPELQDYEARDVLEAKGVVRRPHLLHVRGPLQVGTEIRIENPGRSFIGLAWAEIQSACLLKPVDYVITIENPTSFWRHCAEVDGCYLALLSDGFPARDVLSGMRHFVRTAQAMRATPIYHWGDIDAGGLRIAAHLEDAFETPLRLHQMNPTVANENGTSLGSRKGLQRLMMRPGPIGELARWLDGKDALALEQEELDPVKPSMI